MRNIKYLIIKLKVHTKNNFKFLPHFFSIIHNIDISIVEKNLFFITGKLFLLEKRSEGTAFEQTYNI